jgi:hypothetical protein
MLFGAYIHVPLKNKRKDQDKCYMWEKVSITLILARLENISHSLAQIIVFLNLGTPRFRQKVFDALGCEIAMWKIYVSLSATLFLVKTKVIYLCFQIQ